MTMLQSLGMNTKAIIIGVVVLIIVGIGAYAIMTRPSGTGTQTPATNNSQAGSTTNNTASQTPTSNTPSDQVQAQDVAVGTGTAAAPGTVVSVLYIGKLTDGTVFDSSASHGNQPLKFQLGAQGLIPGFQIGVNGMKEGGERLVAIPPTLGYGQQDVKDQAGKVIIPASSTLVFDIKLIKVEPASAAPAAPAAPAKK